MMLKRYGWQRGRIYWPNGLGWVWTKPGFQEMWFKTFLGFCLMWHTWKSLGLAVRVGKSLNDGLAFDIGPFSVSWWNKNRYVLGCPRSQHDV